MRVERDIPKFRGANIACNGPTRSPHQVHVARASTPTPQEALAYMKQGDLDVTVFQDAAGQGKGALEAAIKLAKGEAVDQKVYIPFQLVTPANINDYLKKN